MLINTKTCQFGSCSHLAKDGCNRYCDNNKHDNLCAGPKLTTCSNVNINPVYDRILKQHRRLNSPCVLDTHNIRQLHTMMQTQHWFQQNCNNYTIQTTKHDQETYEDCNHCDDGGREQQHLLLRWNKQQLNKKQLWLTLYKCTRWWYVRTLVKPITTQTPRSMICKLYFLYV